MGELSCNAIVHPSSDASIEIRLCLLQLFLYRCAFGLDSDGAPYEKIMNGGSNMLKLVTIIMFKFD